MLGAEIAERRADPREDILSLLVSARFEDGEPMDDAEIRDQLMTLLLAGHETTATGLAWTFDLLLRHPHVLARLAPGRGRDEAYLRAVVAGVAAAAPGRPARRPAPEPGAARERPRAPARHRRDAGDLARPHARRPLPRALRVPPRALPRGRARDLRVDPVRRRRAALPRGGVRGDGDAGRAGGDPRAADAAAGVGRGRAGRAAQRHLLAARRHPGDRTVRPLASLCGLPAMAWRVPLRSGSPRSSAPSPTRST